MEPVNSILGQLQGRRITQTTLIMVTVTGEARVEDAKENIIVREEEERLKIQVRGDS